MSDEALERLRGVGLRPGDVVTSNASSGLPMYRDRDRREPWTPDQLPFAWFPCGGLGLVLAVGMSHHPAAEARPAALLLALSMEPAHVMGWTTEVEAYEAIRTGDEDE